MAGEHGVVEQVCPELSGSDCGDL